MKALLVALIFVFGFQVVTKGQTNSRIDSTGFYRDMEGYFVSLKGDTSFVTFKIPVYLEQPSYVLLQILVKYRKDNRKLKKLTPESVSSYGFNFKNELIIMIPCKLHREFLFLHLSENILKLPDGKYELFALYSFPSNYSPLFREPPIKEYIIKTADQQLIFFNDRNFEKKFAQYLSKSNP